MTFILTFNGIFNMRCCLTVAGVVNARYFKNGTAVITT